MTKVKNTKVNNTKVKNTKKNTLSEQINVSYTEIVLQKSKTYTIPELSTLYRNPPIINIKNAKNKHYLITMTDPDAPYGMNTNNNINTTNTTTKNHTYTHWVYLQEMRNTKNTNTTNTTNTKIELVPYAPPTPPFGIHRYQFKLYDISNLQQSILDTLKKNSMNNNLKKKLDRNTYYRNNLKKLKKNKLNTEFEYLVNSGK
jgi:phosphatidylethanolamine-binding protein (PEBP) family uncharacterized protein